MSTTTLQVNLDPFYTTDSKRILKLGDDVAENTDIFEVPSSYSVETITALKEKHSNKSILVRVDSLDAVKMLVDSGVNMIGFVGKTNDEFDFKPFVKAGVKFVVDLTDISLKSKLVTANQYLENGVNMFNFNIKSIADITQILPLVQLQTFDGLISVTGRFGLSDIQTLVLNKVNNIVLVDTTPDVESSNAFGAILKSQNNAKAFHMDSLDKETARCSVLSDIITHVEDGKLDDAGVIEKLDDMSAAEQSFTYIKELAAEYATNIRSNPTENLNLKTLRSKLQVAQVVESAIRSTIEQCSDEILSTTNSIGKIESRVKHVRSLWYGNNYVYNVNKVKAARNLVKAHAELN
jgi:hypothetical protein